MILGLMVAVLVAGCGGGGGQAAQEAQQARLDELRQAKAALDDLRQELATARAQLAQATAAEDGESEPAAEGEDPAEVDPAAVDPAGVDPAGVDPAGVDPAAVDPAALAARIQQLESQVIAQTDDFGAALVGFINENAPEVGQPMTEVQKAAISMKSEEDILLARTYIDEGGDYARAIRIYQDALLADPNNAHLQEVLASAQELRHMTPERFAAVAKGMSQDEVRQALGQVYHRNIREYPDREVVAWFYPTGEGGAAAGVFFRKERRSDDFVVYQTNFEAVPGRGVAVEAPSE
jgi:tetratricopeptide (TPR) repeat protein